MLSVVDKEKPVGSTHIVPGASIFQKTAAKTIFYGNNGGGRDTYISSNNGGLCLEKSTCKAAELGKCSFSTPIEATSWVPSLALFSETYCR